MVDLNEPDKTGHDAAGEDLGGPEMEDKWLDHVSVIGLLLLGLFSAKERTSGKSGRLTTLDLLLHEGPEGRTLRSAMSDSFLVSVVQAISNVIHHLVQTYPFLGFAIPFAHSGFLIIL